MDRRARDILLIRLEQLKPQLELNGVKHLELFGSRSRMDNRTDSDIDLVVEVDDGAPFSMLDLVGVGHVVEDNLGLPANIFMKRSLDNGFLDEIRPDLIKVF